MECGWCWHVNVGSLMPHIHVPFWCWGRARVGRDVWEIPVPSSRFYYELKSTLKIIFIKGGGVAGRGGGSCLEGFPVKIWLYLTPSLAQGLMGPCIYAVYAYMRIYHILCQRGGEMDLQLKRPQFQVRHTTDVTTAKTNKQKTIVY